MKTHRAIRRRRTAGFTLIEIMAVVLIIGLLIGAVGGPVMNALFKGTTARVKMDIKQMDTAITLYKSSNFNYPDSLSDLTEENNGEPPLLDVLSLDPWGNDYFYEPPQSGDDYIIGTYGRDGSPGGEGEDADITNQTLKERD